MAFLRVRMLLRPTSSGEEQMRHWRTNACHRILSFFRIWSNMAVDSGFEPKYRVMARVAQKHAGHTQRVLRALPLLTMCVGGRGGPQSNSQVTNVSASLVTLAYTSESVAAPVCKGQCVPDSFSSVALESCHSASCSAELGLPQEDVQEVAMVAGAATRVTCL